MGRGEFGLGQAGLFGNDSHAEITVSRCRNSLVDTDLKFFDWIGISTHRHAILLAKYHRTGESMSKKKPQCPQCDSKNIAVIEFGFPSPEMIEGSDRGEIVLGGCCVTEDDPEWHCKDCEYEW